MQPAISSLFAVLLSATAACSFAQSTASPGAAGASAAIETLAPKFKGTFTMRNPVSARYQSNAIELEITSQDAGTIAGTFTRYVNFPGSPENLCTKADKLPMSATYDGQKLTMVVQASRNHPSCNDFTWVVLRGNEHFFERQAADGSWSLYYDPIQ